MCDVLLVDDDFELLVELSGVLGGHGYRVDSAHHMGALADALATCRPKVLVTDLSLADGNGLEVIARVRSLQPDARIVLVSGDMDALARYGGGVDDTVFLIEKPIALAPLLRFLARVVPSSQARESRRP